MKATGWEGKGMRRKEGGRVTRRLMGTRVEKIANEEYRGDKLMNEGVCEPLSLTFAMHTNDRSNVFFALT